MKRAIVLSGGGSKGAYQMGVWKALRKLKIDYSIVTGTSVGALNGALMVEKKFNEGMYFWKNLGFELIFDDPNNEFKKANNIKDIYKIYAKNIMNGGINPIQLEKLAKSLIKEKKVRNSKIDYGLVTVNVSNLKAKCLSKKDIPKGQLVDYILASATCFPAFKVKEINNQKFIDGGIYDNLPINLALKLGAEEIIAVDLEEIGLKRKPKKDAKIIYISPNNDLGQFLVFDSSIAKKNIRYGYNDTMKVFKKLEGKKFTFKKNTLQFNYNQHKKRFVNLANQIYQEINKQKKLDKLLISKNLKVIVTGREKEVMKKFNDQLEYLGKVFNIDDSLIYTTRKFNNILKRKVLLETNVNLDNIEKQIKNNQIKKLLHTKTIIKYLYNKIEEGFTEKNLNILIVASKLFPKDFLGALYLNSIKISLI